MCGRYTVTKPGEILDEAFDELEAQGLEAARDSAKNEGLAAPRFNLAPTQEAPVVVQDGFLARAHTMRWGLVPSWSQGPKGAPLINARIETIGDKRSFAESFEQRRCLVPADGFYEWTPGAKQANFIHLDGGFCFAGLWSRWQDKTQPEQTLESFAIVTGDANSSVESLHHRMPLVLDTADYAAWLDPSFTRREPLLDILRRRSPEWRHHPVGRGVNRVANDDPSLLTEADPEPQNLSLF